MITLNDDIVIDRPVEQVFTFVSNLENAPKWQSDLVTSTLDTAGPIGVGSKFREVTKVLGRKVDALCEITEYDYPTKMAFKATSAAGMDYDGVYIAEPSGADTRLRFTGTVTLKGFLRLLEPLYTGEVKRGLVEEHKRLKAAVEAEEKKVD
jgi:uncharacterized membrane protein